MSVTQIKGSQILDGSITSADMADDVAFSNVDINGNLTLTGSVFMSSGSFTVDGVAGLEITGSLTVTGEISLGSGSNSPVGTVVLNGSNPSTVTNSLVLETSMIYLTKQTATHSAGNVSISSKNAGSFSVVSSAAGDTDVVGYLIINPVQAT